MILAGSRLRYSEHVYDTWRDPEFYILRIYAHDSGIPAAEWKSQNWTCLCDKESYKVCMSTWESYVGFMAHVCTWDWKPQDLFTCHMFTGTWYWNSLALFTVYTYVLTYYWKVTGLFTTRNCKPPGVVQYAPYPTCWHAAESHWVFTCDWKSHGLHLRWNQNFTGFTAVYQVVRTWRKTVGFLYRKGHMVQRVYLRYIISYGTESLLTGTWHWKSQGYLPYMLTLFQSYRLHMWLEVTEII